MLTTALLMHASEYHHVTLILGVVIFFSTLEKCFQWKYSDAFNRKSLFLLEAPRDCIVQELYATANQNS